MSEPFVSPYLLKPLRSLDEVRAERARAARLVAQVQARIAARRLRFGPRPLPRREMCLAWRRRRAGAAPDPRPSARCKRRAGGKK